jgi:hypothetical protein
MQQHSEWLRYHLKNTSAKIRSNPIRPDRSRPTTGTNSDEHQEHEEETQSVMVHQPKMLNPKKKSTAAAVSA